MHSNSHRHFSNETVLNTPKPQACSTVEKKRYQNNFRKQYPDFKNDSDNVLQEIDINIPEEVSYLSSQNEPSGFKDVSQLSEKLVKERSLAMKTLESIGGIPSKYLKPSETISDSSLRIDSEISTITESQLLKNKTCLNDNGSFSFSIANISDLIEEESYKKPIKSIYNNFEEFSHKIKHSDIALKDICGEFSKFTRLSIDSKNNIQSVESIKSRCSAKLSGYNIKTCMVDEKKSKDDFENSNDIKKSKEDIKNSENSLPKFVEEITSDLKQFSDGKLSIDEKKSSNVGHPDEKKSNVKFTAKNTCDVRYPEKTKFSEVIYPKGKRSNPEYPEGKRSIDDRCPERKNSNNVKCSEKKRSSDIGCIKEKNTRDIKYSNDKRCSVDVCSQGKRSNHLRCKAKQRYSESRATNVKEEKISNVTKLNEQFCVDNKTTRNGKPTERLSSTSTLSSDIFLPAEDVKEKFLEDEISWKNKFDIPDKQNLSAFSSLSGCIEEKFSVGEFFREKCDEMSEIFPKHSPEKLHDPVPLISSSSLDLSPTKEISIDLPQKSSIISLSHIAKIIGSADTDSPSKMMDLLMKKNELNAHKKKNSLGEEKVRCSKLTSDFMPTQHSTFRDTSEMRQKTKQFEMKKSPIGQIDADRSISSLRSCSSLDSLVDGKLPIECNKTQLVWSCIKIGKSSTRSFVLKNKSQKKIRFQMCLKSNNYKIITREVEASTSISVVLYPLESKQFEVSFSPTTPGAYIENISFYPISVKQQAEQKQKQNMRLYGYGGHVSVEIRNIFEDPSRKLWLTMGLTENDYEISQTILLRNTGNLDAFSTLKFQPKVIHKNLNVTVQPEQIIIKPNQETTVTVTYILTKSDWKEIEKNGKILELGNIQVVSGAEVTRGRIRNICNKLRNKKCIIDSTMDELSQVYLGELIPSDIKKFNENESAISDLLQQIVWRDIFLVLKHDFDATIIPNLDDTTIFYSLCQNFDDTIGNEISKLVKTLPPLNVLPTTLLLMPPNKISDHIVLSTNCVQTLEFIVSYDEEPNFCVKPRQGFIKPGDTMLLNVFYNGPVKSKTEHKKIQVSTDEDIVEVDITIFFS